jgi:ELWxxDGT repeat protein
MAERSNPHYLTAVGEQLFFVTDGGANGNGLWRTDGTTDGTRFVTSVDALAQGGVEHYPPGNTAEAHGKFLFLDSMRGLWTSDGTAAGTSHVQGVESVRNLVANDLGDAFFHGSQAGTGGELWRFDATEAPSAEVVGRRMFYNNSAYDSPNGAAADANDDLAVDTRKQALQPGGVAGFSNITSYHRGINGIMVDISGLPDDIPLGSSDFSFRTGTGPNTAAWYEAPAPRQITVRPGAGAGGSDRVTLVWDDFNPLDPTTRAQQAVANGWLEVTVHASQRTGLLRPDVFYVGSLVGETANSFTDTERLVNTYDYLRTRAVLGTTANVGNPYDFNRDKVINAADLSIVRAALGKTLPLIEIPEGAAPIAAATSATAASRTSVATELVRRRAGYRPL